VSDTATATSRPLVPGGTPPPSHPGRDRNVRGFLWTFAGLLTAVLTVGWVLAYGPHPLLGPGGLDEPVTCWLSPPAYVGVLAVWGCFRKAVRNDPTIQGDFQ
jgi:hypothetical protein